MSARSITDTLEFGLWKDQYTRIFSIGGSGRVAEVSNYPRAYKRTEYPRYTKDEKFTVTRSECNDIRVITEEPYNAEIVYRDLKGVIFNIGEEATHYIGEILPGAHPLWLEDENLPFSPNPNFHIFPIIKVPAPIKGLTEAGFKSENYNKLDSLTLSKINSDISKGEIKITRYAGESDKQILRFKYRRER